jgi:UDP-N-acetyl-D-mannosaminuronate dehydrogenase
MQYLESTEKEVAKHLRKDQLISLELITYFGSGLGGHCIQLSNMEGNGI